MDISFIVWLLVYGCPHFKEITKNSQRSSTRLGVERKMLKIMISYLLI